MRVPSCSRAAGVALAVLSGALIATPANAAGTSPIVHRFNGGGFDQASAIVVDGAGNSYLAGAVDAAGSDTTFAVVKVDPVGRTAWQGRYDGSRGGVGGRALDVAVDATGNVYAAGFIGDGVPFNTNYDYLVVKFGPDGAQRWAHRYDAPAKGFDQATDVAVDSSGNVYASGFSYGANHDWATLKLSPAGALLWERRHSGPGMGDDRVSGAALAPNGNLVVTGVTKNTGDGETNDVETIAYDAQGAIVWQRRWSDTATSHEIANDLAVDSTGRITITGTTAEAPGPYVEPFPVTIRYDAAGTLLQTIRERAGGDSVSTDAAGSFYLAGFVFLSTSDVNYVAKYSAAGVQQWATRLTAGANDSLSEVEVRPDTAGGAIVAATVRDAFTGNADYLTFRFGADGSELWRHRFNGPIGNNDVVAGLAVDGAGDALVTGTSWNNYVSSGGTADDIVTLRFPRDVVPTNPPLVAPTQLTAAGSTSTNAIQLRWRDNGLTEDGFHIERCANAGCTNFAQVAVANRDATQYFDYGVARGVTYTYRVRAFRGAEASAYTNTASARARKR